MQPMSLQGSYADDDGSESVTWLIAESTRPGWRGRYEVTAEIRGVHVSGTDFTDLEPDEPTEVLALTEAGDLGIGHLTVRVPAKVNAGGSTEGDLVLKFHLGSGKYEPVVDADLTVGDATFSTSQEERLEEVLGTIVKQLDGEEWECCLTCLLSDYSPWGNSNMGMRCHRDARQQYLAVRSKADYCSVPVTEDVPEFYRCDGYAKRIPGTGYRG
jgi:hypothetical protein